MLWTLVACVADPTGDGKIAHSAIESSPPPTEETSPPARPHTGLGHSGAGHSAVVHSGDPGPAHTGGAPTFPEPDFHLVDLNPTSPTLGQTMSPRDELTKVSGWYFTHAS